MVNLKALIEIAPLCASGEADGWEFGEWVQLRESEWLLFAELVKQEKEKLDDENRAHNARDHI